MHGVLAKKKLSVTLRAFLNDVDWVSNELKYIQDTPKQKETEDNGESKEKRLEDNDGLQEMMTEDSDGAEEMAAEEKDDQKGITDDNDDELNVHITEGRDESQEKRLEDSDGLQEKMTEESDEPKEIAAEERDEQKGITDDNDELNVHITEGRDESHVKRLEDSDGLQEKMTEESGGPKEMAAEERDEQKGITDDNDELNVNITEGRDESHEKRLGDSDGLQEKMTEESDGPKEIKADQTTQPNALSDQSMVPEPKKPLNLSLHSPDQNPLHHSTLQDQNTMQGHCTLHYQCLPDQNSPHFNLSSNQSHTILPDQNAATNLNTPGDNHQDYVFGTSDEEDDGFNGETSRQLQPSHDWTTSDDFLLEPSQNKVKRQPAPENMSVPGVNLSDDIQMNILRKGPSKPDSNGDKQFSAENRLKENLELVEYIKSGVLKDYLLSLLAIRKLSQKRINPGFGPIIADDMQTQIMDFLMSCWPEKLDCNALLYIQEIWIPEVIIQAMQICQGLSHLEAVRKFHEGPTFTKEELDDIEKQIIGKKSSDAVKGLKIMSGIQKESLLLEDIVIVSEIEKETEGCQIEINNTGKDEHSAEVAEGSEPAESSCTEDHVSATDVVTQRKKLQFKNLGRRVYDKKLACPFCTKVLKYRLKTHLVTCHSDEPEVARALAKTGHERKILFTAMKNKGNFKNNVRFLKDGKGHFIVSRRPSSRPVDPSDFLPCIYCLAFLKSQELWRHALHCPLKDKPSTEKQVSVKARAQLLLNSAVNEDNEDKMLSEHVLVKMHKDNVFSNIEGDSLILRLGSILINKLGPRRQHDVSQRMRQMARIKMSVNQKSTNKKLMWDLIAGPRFDDIIAAVKSVCKFTVNQEGITCLGKPGLALRIGHTLKKLAEIKFGFALRTGDKKAETDADTFRKLHNAEWNDRISSISLASLKVNKVNKAEILPLTEDLITLKNYLDSKIEEEKQLLKKMPTPEIWQSLSQKILARVLLLNKRRGGECAMIPLSNYMNRPEWTKSAHQEIVNSLSTIERQMLQRMDLVESQGKQNKTVSTLLTKHMVDALDLLNATRKDCSISESNKFLFANRGEGHLSPVDTLFELARNAGCQHPHLITSTRLRKYIATVCQVADFSDQEIDWLTKHLAHDINTHKNFYRMQSSTIELAKVSRILMAVEDGLPAKLTQKSLDDIDLEEMEDTPDTIQEEEEEVDNLLVEVSSTGTVADEVVQDDSDSSGPRFAWGKKRKQYIDEGTTDEDDDGNDTLLRRSSREKKKKRYDDEGQLSNDNDNDSDFEPSTLHDSDDTMECDTMDCKQQKARRWSQDENKFFLDIFKNCIEANRMPNGAELSTACKKIPSRTRAQIRTKVNNVIKKKQAVPALN